MVGGIQGDSGEQHDAGIASPARRDILRTGGLLAVAGVGATMATPASAGPAQPLSPAALAARTGRSPWGYETDREPTPAPHSVRPGEAAGLPASPRAYTDIKSYHAHVYFDEDSFEKASLVRKWVGERFEVELGNWNAEPRGPHVTPSFYFGFTPELQPIILPWLQLNSLGLTILIHPNTDDPRADHLYYALWVNRSQPVNAYGMKKANVAAGEPAVEQTYPNTRPTVAIERS